MTLMKEPEFDLDRLTSMMRAELSRQRAGASLNHHQSEDGRDGRGPGVEASDAQALTAATGATRGKLSSSRRKADARSASPVHLEPIALQPQFEPRADDSYHVADLLQYHDRNFVQNAYRAILKRGPDATGFRDFIDALRSGRLNKIDILARLRYSSEGRAKKVRVKGLLMPAVIRQSYRVPALGYALQLFVALARLPSAARGQQQFEAHALAQLEQLADYANACRTALVNHASEVAQAQAQLGAEVRGQQQQLETLAGEQGALRASQQQMLDETSARLVQLQRHLETLLSESESEWRAQLSGLEARFDEERAGAGQRAQELEARLASEGAARNEQVQMLHRSIRSETEGLRREIERASHQLQAGTDRAVERQQQLRAEMVLQGQRVTRLLEEVSGRIAAQQTSAPGTGEPQSQDAHAQKARAQDAHAPVSQGQDAHAPTSEPRTAHLQDSQLLALADEERHALDAFYVSFEDQFRGSRAEIKERLKVYLPLLKRAGIGDEGMPVLDIGCGRGEWLELLQDEKMRASGVDLNRVLVQQCRERGLEVFEDDVMRALRSMPAGSVGAVTGFHLVEHLPLEILIKMLDETVRVLKPGGAVIFETPNPQNVLVGSCNFYFDPTHRNPLPPPVLQFFVESRGFARVSVMNLNPSDTERVAGDTDLINRFNHYFYGPMDYAVVGWKV